MFHLFTHTLDREALGTGRASQRLQLVRTHVLWSFKLIRSMSSTAQVWSERTSCDAIQSCLTAWRIPLVQAVLYTYVLGCVYAHITLARPWLSTNRFSHPRPGACHPASHRDWR